MFLDLIEEHPPSLVLDQQVASTVALDACHDWRVGHVKVALVRDLFDEQACL